jgi:hypothetical protein
MMRTQAHRLQRAEVLRAGLRKALVDMLIKVGGAKIGRKLTERAVMEVAVPGIGIPIAAGANYFFTKHTLRIANVHMTRRGAIVQPLLQRGSLGLCGRFLDSVMGARRRMRPPQRGHVSTSVLFRALALRLV